MVRRRGVSSRLSGNLNLLLLPTSRQPTPHPGINRDAGVVVQKESSCIDRRSKDSLLPWRASILFYPSYYQPISFVESCSTLMDESSLQTTHDPAFECTEEANTTGQDGCRGLPSTPRDYVCWGHLLDSFLSHLLTIAHVPQKPEHCFSYQKLMHSRRRSRSFQDHTR